MAKRRITFTDVEPLDNYEPSAVVVSPAPGPQASQDDVRRLRALVQRSLYGVFPDLRLTTWAKRQLSALDNLARLVETGLHEDQFAALAESIIAAPWHPLP